MMLKKSTSQKALAPAAAPARVGRFSSCKPDYAKMTKHVSLDRSAAGVDGDSLPIRKSAMKKYVKPKAEAIVDALLDADQMESTARYLSSGRRFASLEAEETKRRWTEAVRIFLASYCCKNPREMDDLGSELRLRKVPLPEENVRDQVVAVARRIQQDDGPEVRSRIRDRIRSFRDSLERPQN